MSDLRAVHTLTLTAAEYGAVEFARGRYEWATALYDLDASELNSRVVFITGHESDWWAVIDAVRADDAPYPLAAPSLASKIEAFLERFE